MLQELVTTAGLESRIPQTLVTQDIPFDGYPDIYEIHDGDEPLPNVDEVLTMFSDRLIDDIFKTPEPKQFVVPVNGGHVPMLHMINRMSELKASGDLRFKDLDLERWLEENTVLSFHSELEVELRNLRGAPTSLDPGKSIFIIDDIGDSLKTMSDICKVSTDPGKVHLYAPTIKIPTITRNIDLVSNDVSKHFHLNGDFSLKQNLHAAMIFPSRNIDGTTKTIWVAGGAGLNRGSENDTLEIAAKQRLSSRFYYSKMDGLYSLVNQETELEFLDQNMSALAKKFPFLVDGFISMERMKKLSGFEGVAIVAHILLSKVLRG